MVYFVLMGMTYFLFVTTSLQKKKGKRIKGWDKMSNSHLFWSKNIQKLQKKDGWWNVFIMNVVANK